MGSYRRVAPALVASEPAARGGFAARIARGDETALADLYDQAATTVYALALALTADPRQAEEITMATFLGAWRETGAGGTGCEMDPLLSATQRLAAQRRATRPDHEGRDARLEPTPANRRGASTPARLDELSDLQQISVALTIIGKHTYRETADMLGADAATIAESLREALTVLSKP